MTESQGDTIISLLGDIGQLLAFVFSWVQVCAWLLISVVFFEAIRRGK